jgi:hypothetical protein
MNKYDWLSRKNLAEVCVAKDAEIKQLKDDRIFLLDFIDNFYGYMNDLVIHERMAVVRKRMASDE